MWMEENLWKVILCGFHWLDMDKGPMAMNKISWKREHGNLHCFMMRHMMSVLHTTRLWKFLLYIMYC